MPTSLTHQITTRYKLAKDEHGMTQLGTRQMGSGTAIQWILDTLLDANEDAVEIAHENDGKTAIITIHWDKLPEYARNPKIPPPRRR
jgi:hypothetical protein